MVRSDHLVTGKPNTYMTSHSSTLRTADDMSGSVERMALGAYMRQG